LRFVDSFSNERGRRGLGRRGSSAQREENQQGGPKAE
jgi:hypothetical protein